MALAKLLWPRQLRTIPTANSSIFHPTIWSISTTLKKDLKNLYSSHSKWRESSLRASSRLRTLTRFLNQSLKRPRNLTSMTLRASKKTLSQPVRKSNLSLDTSLLDALPIPRSVTRKRCRMFSRRTALCFRFPRRPALK